jgi:WD40 repeat protein/class 3 adenylate cyclase
MMHPEPRARAPDRDRPDTAPATQRSGLVTLVFTDIVGSTALKQALGDREGLGRIQEHHALVRELLRTSHGAQELKTAGDSFLLLFERPSEAVRWALQLQHRLRAANRGQTHPIFDRVGIHLGEVVVEGETGSARDVHGLQVDLAARVMSLAEPGQILLSRTAFDSARQALKGEDHAGLGDLSWLNHGPYTLKGVEEPVEICEVGEASFAVLRAPSDSTKAQRHVSAEAEPVLGWRPAAGQAVPNSPWILERKLGEGGFGEVWLGHHRVLKDRRVFKFCFRADRARSLKRELTLFRLLKERVGRHPNIVGVEDVFFDTPPFYLMMDAAEGTDLRSWCEQQGGVETVPLEVRAEIVAQVADALQAAHDAGVIHRDVKPGNILISAAARNRPAPPQSDALANPAAATERGQLGCPVHAWLTDFGIGQVLSEEALAGVTRTGFTQTLVAGSSSSQTGSQVYMAPELLAGQPASTRSDIYSLGVVLYQLLVGDFTRPVTTDWQRDVSDALLCEDLQSCFAGRPQERFAGIGQLADRLRSLPERRARLERERADQAVLERAAYRRGVWRAAAIAGLVVAGAGLLAVAALNSARHLRRSLYLADVYAAGEALQAEDLAAARRLLEKYRRPRPWQEELRGLEYRWLWERCRGDAAVTLTQYTKSANCVVLSPDGRWLATGGSDRTVRVIELATRREVVSFAVFDADVDTRGVAFSPDGKWLAAKGGTHAVIWSTATWQPAAQFEGKRNWNHNEPVLFSPDSQSFLMRVQLPGEHPRQGRESLRFWRPTDWSAAGNLDGDNGFGTVLAYSQDGALLACSRWNELQIRDSSNLTILTNLVRNVAEVNRVMAVAFSDQFLVAGYRDGGLTIWRLSDWREVARVQTQSSFLIALRFSPDGRYLASGGGDHAIRLWDVHDFLQPGEPEGVQPHRRLRGHVGDLYAIEFSRDGTLLFSASADGTVKQWDLTEPSIAGALAGETRQAHWFSPTVDTLVTSLRAGRYGELQLKRLDLKSGVETDITLPPAPAGVRQTCAISPDGRLLALGGTSGTLELCDLSRPESISFRELPRSVGSIDTLVMNHRGGLLAAVSGFGTAAKAQVWELEPSRLLSELEIAFGPIAFSPDGLRFAALNARRGISVWNSRTGIELAALESAPPPVYSMAFSPDARWLAFSSEGRKLCLWKIGTRTLDTLEGPSWQIAALAFSPEGRTLISCTYDNVIGFWNMAERKLALRVQSDRPGGAHLLLARDASLMAVRSRSAQRGLELWRFPTLAEIDSKNPRNAHPTSKSTLSRRK